MTLEAREGGSGSPRIGAEVGIGEPGATPTAVRVEVDEGDGAGALYMNVAASTIDDPTTKARVMG